MLLIVDTGWAKPVESEFMAVHHEPVLLTDVAVKVVGQFDLAQIHHRAAATANKVTVRGRDAVESLMPTDHSYAPDIAPFLKKDQVAVDGSQTQVGMAGFQGLVDPFGGGVAIRALDGRENGGAFLTVSCRAFHLMPPNNIDSYLRKDDTIWAAVCKEENNRK